MLRELRRAVINAGRDPATTAISIVTLAFAVAAATAVISVVNAVLVAPLPFAEPDRLHHVGATNNVAGELQAGLSLPDLLDLHDAGAGLAELAGYYAADAVLTGEDTPRQLAVGYTSLNFFSVLGADAVVGSPYSATSGSGPAATNQALNQATVAIISDSFWRRIFGADPGIVGRQVVVDGELRRIVGVMPSALRLPNGATDMWMPWDMGQQRRNDRFLGVVARLHDAAADSPLRGQLQATAADLAQRFPDTNAGWSAQIEPISSILLGDIERPLWILSAAVFLVLAVAAANVAGLLVARNWRRLRDIAVQRALGASGWDVTRGLVAESLLIAVAAAVAGVALGAVALAALPRLRVDMPLRADMALDAGVIAASAAVAILAGLVAGLAPALQALRVDPAVGMRAGGRASAGRSHLRVRAGLIAAEAALVTVLLVAAALLLNSFVQLTRVTPGFEPADVVVARIELEPGAAGSAASRVAFFDNLLADLGSRSAVVAAGATTVMPMDASGTDFNRPFWRDGEANPGGTAPEADIRMVSPGYFRSIGIPLLGGRDFGPGDRFDGEAFGAGERLLIVNRSLAEQMWPGEDAVGQRLMMDYPRQVYAYEVVGVVGNARYYGPRTEPRPEVYIPYAQNPYPGMSVVIRVRDDVEAMIEALPGIVADLNVAQPVHDVMAVQQLVADNVGRDRLLTVLLTAFGALALLVAAVGVYGLVAANVAGRTRELGIRRAIGARAIDLVRQVLWEVVRVVGAGVAIGVGLSLAVAGLLGDILFRTNPTDPLILSAVAAFMLAVVGLAGVVPALRATGVEPSVALRRE